jgi:aryl-alcohol dehydrogenase-like predicted oxidoreductase
VDNRDDVKAFLTSRRAKITPEQAGLTGRLSGHPGGDTHDTRTAIGAREGWAAGTPSSSDFFLAASRRLLEAVAGQERRELRSPDMKSAHLGALEVSRIGLGAMTMAGTYTSEGGLDNAESIRTVHRALDLGVTHIDTAEIYGPFLSGELVGEAIKGRRDQVRIATKFGLVSHAGGGPGVADSSAANVKAAVEGSLKRLGTDHIDLYYQHRVDRDTPIEETAAAVADFIAQGKVLHFGLSEASPETIRRAHAVQPVTALQTEYSLWTRAALAWILTRGDDIAPIPGTRRVARVEENTAADAVELTPAQIERLDTLRPAAGARHDDANMASIDR